MTCPKCHYALSPFEAAYPRCDRVFNSQTNQHAPAHAANGLLRRDILNGTSTL